MASATFEDHPTDPDKVILRKKPYLDKGRDYEEGFVDGMQHQMQSSVDKAVNRMAQPEQEPVAWVGEISEEAELMLEKPKFQAVPLYTTPPQRKPLTRERLVEMAEAQCGAEKTFEDWVELFGRDIEAAHGIKE